MKKCVLSAAITFFLAISAYSPLSAQVKLGLGSYYTENKGFPVPSATPSVISGFPQKINSTTWFVTLVSEKYSMNLWAHPLSFRAESDGMQIGYPGASFEAGANFHVSADKPLKVGVEGLNAPSADLASFSHFAVTARFSGSGKTLDATFGQGMPFAYFKVTGGNAIVSTNGGTIWYNGGNFIGITAGGKHFAVFGPTGSSWSGTSTLSSNLGGKDYFCIAVLPEANEQTLNIFAKYAFSYVVDTKVTWVYDENTGRLISTFHYITQAKEGTQTGTVFALMRHHWLETVTPLTNLTYSSARGTMKVGEGESFTTSMIFNGILPAMPEIGYDKAQLGQYVNQSSSCDDVGATYAKPFGKMAVLADIADQVGNTGRRDDLVNCLKQKLEQWFTADGTNRVFYYHNTWNRLIGYPGGFYSDTRLTDHHFHYGYFIKGASTVAKYDPEWAAQSNWGGMVELLIRDLNTWDSNDPLFSSFGYFSPFEGHGWADGMGFERGTDQESSSESMNANAAIILWGVHTGNKVIRDMGIFMYAMEARAIEQYWWDVDAQVFPQGFNHTTVGMLWGDGGSYSTWFSGNTGAIHAINFLPITAGHLYLGRRPDYIPKNYEEGFSGQWPDLFYEFLSFADGETGYSRAQNSSVEGGNSKAYMYHHTASIRAMGQLNTQATANVPTFAVFDKGNTRTYTAYNPENEAKVVAFNDGHTMTVPAKTQVTEQGTAMPITGISFMKHGSKADVLPRLLVNMGLPGQALELLQSGAPGLHDLTGKQLSEGVRAGIAPGIYLQKPAGGTGRQEGAVPN